MVTSEQIEAWINEIAARPASAPGILRAIAARLSELDAWNDELLTDNIALRSGSRVEEYEKRLAALERQLEMIRRQVGAGGLALQEADEVAASLLIFNPRGQILRLNLDAQALDAAGSPGKLAQPPADGAPAPGLLLMHPAEELLAVFDSGRTVILPVAQIPPAPGLDWANAHRVDPRPGEELAALLPLARLALFDGVVQASRRGCAKLMLKGSFEKFIAGNAIGAGIKRKPDKTAGLALILRDGMAALATREGWLVGMSAGQLPFAAEEILQMGLSDYVVSVFSPGKKGSLLALTNTGKALNREAGWLEAAVSFKGRGQALIPASRREAGVRLAGAAAVDAEDVCAVMLSDGSLALRRAGALLADGSIETGGAEALALAVFSVK